MFVSACFCVRLSVFVCVFVCVFLCVCVCVCVCMCFCVSLSMFVCFIGESIRVCENCLCLSIFEPD